MPWPSNTITYLGQKKGKDLLYKIQNNNNDFFILVSTEYSKRKENTNFKTVSMHA